MTRGGGGSTGGWLGGGCGGGLDLASAQAAKFRGHPRFCAGEDAQAVPAGGCGWRGRGGFVCLWGGFVPTDGRLVAAVGCLGLHVSSLENVASSCLPVRGGSRAAGATNAYKGIARDILRGPCQRTRPSPHAA